MQHKPNLPSGTFSIAIYQSDIKALMERIKTRDTMGHGKRPLRLAGWGLTLKNGINEMMRYQAGEDQEELKQWLDRRYK